MFGVEGVEFGVEVIAKSGNLGFFLSIYAETLKFLARAFGARDVFKVIWLGRHAKNDHRHPRAGAFDPLSVRLLLSTVVTYKAKSGVN